MDCQYSNSLLELLADFDNTLSPPSEDEIKDDQWLGVTLKSQGPGGKVLVRARMSMREDIFGGAEIRGRHLETRWFCNKAPSSLIQKCLILKLDSV